MISWQTEKLNNICDIGTGKWDANHATQNGKYKFFTCAKESVYCDTFKFSGECLILPGNGVNVGEVFYYNGDFDAYQRTYVLSNTKVEAKFLHYHLLLYWKERNLSKQFGSATNFIKMENFLNYEISFPSIEEQKRIVGILDEVFYGIAKAKEATEKNLKNAREVFESYLQSVFSNSKKGWKSQKLGEVCDFKNGQAHEKEIDEDGKYKLINSKFISSNGEKFKKTNKALSPLFKGDIVFVMSDVPNGKTLAKCFVIDRDDTYTLNQRICVIRSNNFDKKFLYYHLNRHKFLLSFDNGENQTNLRKDDILNCPLFVPTLEEQKSIVAKLDALSAETKKLEEIYKQKLTHLEELKKSILKKAFNGEL